MKAIGDVIVGGPFLRFVFLLSVLSDEQRDWLLDNLAKVPKGRPQLEVVFAISEKYREILEKISSFSRRSYDHKKN